MENINRREFIALATKTAISIGLINLQSPYITKQSTFATIWNTEKSYSAEFHLLHNAKDASGIKSSIKRDFEYNNIDCVHGIFLAETEFALLAYLEL